MFGTADNGKSGFLVYPPLFSAREFILNSQNSMTEFNVRVSAAWVIVDGKRTS